MIDFLAAAPEHQGRGHGHRLLTAALSELVKDCNLLELRTALENFRAAQIYGKFGFRVVAADYMLHYSLD
ncbi:GNAT family N-acetyltransferase [bacterium]|nr:GNAT family N-acetyltransferase [bacterium]